MRNLQKNLNMIWQTPNFNFQPPPPFPSILKKSNPPLYEGGRVELCKQPLRGMNLQEKEAQKRLKHTGNQKAYRKAYRKVSVSSRLKAN